VDEAFIAKSQSVFSSLPQHLKESSDFIKMFISVLMPYQSKDVHFETTISNSQIMGICQKHDFEALASNRILKEIRSIDNMYHYIFTFFKNKIMAPEKFKKILNTLVILQLGITTKEILELVLS